MNNLTIKLTTYLLALGSLLFARTAVSQDQVLLTYGSTFDFGNTVLSLFSNEAKVGFDSSTQGLVAFGYFEDTYDVGAIDKSTFGETDFTALISNFNVLHETSEPTNGNPSGFLTGAQQITEAGVGKTGYLLTLSGVTSFASASSAQEVGLFTDASIGTIISGGDPFADYNTTSVSYLSDILGNNHDAEDMSAVFGAGWTANIYASQTIAAAVPEPSTYALLLGAASFGFVYYRRKVASKKGQQDISESETVA